MKVKEKIEKYLKENRVDKNKGLKNVEVEEQVRNNKVNNDTVSASRTTKEIVVRNAITLFNVLNILLAIMVLWVGDWKNVLFAGAIVSNTIIGIYQELKSRKMVEKLSFLKQDKVIVIRENEEVGIDRKDIVVNDILLLKKGMKLPVDVICLENGMMVDESLITGESMAVEKYEGDVIYSGSLIMQGFAKSQVLEVGNNTYISKLTTEAKKYKSTKSKIQKYTTKILNIITIILIPMIILIFINQLFLSETTDIADALLGSAAAIIGMLPEGLVLLTSVAFATGVIKLSSFNTITQDLPAIETLARVDVICIDKTGTITEGKMSVDDVIYYGSNKEKINSILSFIVENDTEQNMSTEALKKHFKKDGKKYVIDNYIPFSSETKWQAMELREEGTYILGAFDILDVENSLIIEEDANKYLEKGHRVIALAHSNKKVNHNELPEDARIVSLIFIKDKVKKDAKEILNYFKEQNVIIKVLSGDHPNTIVSIANEVGLDGNALNATDIPDNMSKLKECVEDTTIFGRVVPEQKRNIIKALQANGHTVAMIGDGINDILAMKQSDCAVAFAAGSEATKAVSQFVLLENDFSTLPEVVRQGRKIINNMNRVAGLYLVRVIYSFLLSLLLIFFKEPFPLEPISLSTVSTLGIGVPSFLLTFEKNEHKAHDNFLKHVLLNSIPSGIVITLSLLFIILFRSPTMSDIALRTASTLVIGSIQMAVLYILCRPLTTYRRVVVFLMIAAFYISYFIPPLTYLLNLTTLSIEILKFAIPVILVAITSFVILHKILREKVFKLEEE